MTEFRKELTQLINQHSKENGSDTPDYILADYLESCLVIFDTAIRNRDRWHDEKKTDTKNYSK